MIDKQKYREFCKKEKSLPIFSKDWWLDAVCGEDNWSVVLIENDGEIIASLPYFKKKEYGFNIITMPPLTQNFKLWIRYPKEQKYAGKLVYEKKVITEVINRLPKFDMFNLNFHYLLTNWLPFYWKDFKQTTRYTYVIEDLTDLDRIFSGLRSNIRQNIRKAKKIVKVYTENNLEKFYNINKMTFDRQNMDIPYYFGFLDILDKTCNNNNCRKIFFGEDEDGQIHAAIYLIWDAESAYYLLGGGDPKLRNSGATSLLMWEAIKFSSTVTKKFDFEGSMVELIERYFRAFGGTQKPYFNITKINSKILHLALHARGINSKILHLALHARGIIKK